MEKNDFSPETLNEMEMDAIVGGTFDTDAGATYNCHNGNCAAGCGVPVEVD